MANTIELVLLSANPSPQPKRQIDRISRFCTAHGIVSSGTLASLGKYDSTCAHWRYLANTIEFLLLSQPNSQPKRQIDRFSRFARLTVESPCGRPFSPKLPLPMGIWTHLTHDFWAHPSPKHKRRLDRFSRLCTNNHRVSHILYNRTHLSLSKLPPGIWTASNTWFAGPTRVLNPNGISISSAVFAGLTKVTDQQTTGESRYSVGNNRPHLRTA